MDLKIRAKRFTVYTIRFVRALPRDLATDALTRQLLRSACSVSANHRAAFRSRSEAEVVAKLGIVEEEADECIHWLEILNEVNGRQVEADRLISEANEILAMTIASIKTMRSRSKRTSG